MTRRIAALIAGLFIAVAALAGCSHPAAVSYAPAAVSYAPAAYGMQVGGVYECYYVNSPLEVQTLVANGYCPAGSVPTHMPESWLDEYFMFYDSPAYYNVYVPVAYRTTYISTYHTYYVSHTTVINTASRSATWKGSNGKTVSGSQVNTAKMKFSTGSGSTGKVGGGSLRVGTLGGSSGGVSGGSGGSKTTTTVKSRTGGSGGSVGGGSLRGRK